MPTEKLNLNVNGADQEVDVRPDAPLLYILRNDLELNSPKYGCGLGQCGACTVLIDGVAARSCLIPVSGTVGRKITTLEGLGSIDKQAAQCGYCISGMVMATRALLDRNPSPSDDEIRQELAFNLCRCGTHMEIMQAVRQAADSSKSTADRSVIEKTA